VRWAADLAGVTEIRAGKKASDGGLPVGERVQVRLLNADPTSGIRFQLLFPDRESLYQIQIALRLDSRIEKTELALLAELQRGNSTYYTDTLRFRLADQPEVWLRPGTVFHEYKAGLARPLQMPYTGLFYLRLTPLGRVTLTGVSAVGVGMKERPKTN